MIDAESACEILGWIEDRGIEVWVDGGWGVDVLLGESTRNPADHDDMERLQGRFEVILPLALCPQKTART